MDECIKKPLPLYPIKLLLIVFAFFVSFLSFGCTRVFYNAKIVSYNPTLVRSSYPSYEFLGRLHHSFRDKGGLKLIVNLTCEVSDEEKEFGEQNHMPIVKMCWSARKAPPKEDIEYLVGIFKNSKNYPMLIHCKAGADRSGLATALWRIEVQGVRPELAISEMKWFGHFHPKFPEMQNTIIERYNVKKGRLFILNTLYSSVDLLLLYGYIAEDIIQEIELLD